MDGDHREGSRRESQSGHDDDAAKDRTLTILRRYSSGEISARDAAKAIGPTASEHDVFAGILAARLPLPVPDSEDLARQVLALRLLYGSRGQEAANLMPLEEEGTPPTSEGALPILHTRSKF